MLSDALQFAGVKLAPGSYTVQPYSSGGHIYVTCTSTRTSAFSIDLSTTVLTFTVSHGLVSTLCTNQSIQGKCLLWKESRDEHSELGRATAESLCRYSRIWRVMELQDTDSNTAKLI